jgi:hypothetical protein
MYKIEKNDAGFKLTFSGTTNKEELERWLKESENALKGIKGAFSVIIDMRTLVPLRPDAQALMVKGQGLFRAKGMQRSAVILNDAVVTGQFMRLAKESGIYAYERYIDASSDSQWHRHAEDWVRSGVDPDKVLASTR